MSGIKMEVLGNVGKAAELKYLSTGLACCEFPVAANERWKNKQGVVQKRTEWTTVRLYGKQAEALAQYIYKGRQIQVEGKQRTDKWTDQDGVVHYRVYLRANPGGVTLLGARREESSQEDDGPSREEAREDINPDLPF